MEFKSEKILKRIWFFPGAQLSLGKQRSIAYFDFIFPCNIFFQGWGLRHTLLKCERINWFHTGRTGIKQFQKRNRLCAPAFLLYNFIRDWTHVLIFPHVLILNHPQTKDLLRGTKAEYFRLLNKKTWSWHPVMCIVGSQTTKTGVGRQCSNMWNPSCAVIWRQRSDCVRLFINTHWDFTWVGWKTGIILNKSTLYPLSKTLIKWTEGRWVCLSAAQQSRLMRNL